MGWGNLWLEFGGGGEGKGISAEPVFNGRLIHLAPCNLFG